MPANGYNALRWKCAERGCFNVKVRPKIERFADCFPGRINFGDVDGLVEMSGVFCLLEWKGDGGQVQTGQHISFTNFTKQQVGNIVFVVAGNSETMDVTGYFVYWKGKRHPWVDANLDSLKLRIKGWADYAGSRNKIIPLRRPA